LKASVSGAFHNGDIAMAIFVGYGIGQWLPKILQNPQNQAQFGLI